MPRSSWTSSSSSRAIPDPASSEAKIARLPDATTADGMTGAPAAMAARASGEGEAPTISREGDIGSRKTEGDGTDAATSSGGQEAGTAWPGRSWATGAAAARLLSAGAGTGDTSGTVGSGEMMGVAGGSGSMAGSTARCSTWSIGGKARSRLGIAAT